VAGLALAVAVTPWLILVGAVSFAASWLYTGGPRPCGYYGFGELFVFVFFGLVATVGSAYVQQGRFTRLPFAPRCRWACCDRVTSREQLARHQHRRRRQQAHARGPHRMIAHSRFYVA
jgi:hypothetical protein